MEFETWHLWILATIIFVLLEIFIPSFVMISIATGCLFAAGTAFFHGSVALQILLFIVGTLTGFFGVKPMMIKYAYTKKSINTNASALIGKIGKVVDEINPGSGTGSVAIDGDIWTARSETGESIPAGEKVRVTQLESIVVTVIPAGETYSKSKIPPDPGDAGKSSLLIRIGSRTVYINYDEVLYLYSKNKITYIVTKAGKHYIHDESLDRLTEQLPAELFFRANRQFVLKRDIISEIKSVNNGKIEVFLKPQNGSEKYISVSRLKAHAFRQWMNRT